MNQESNQKHPEWRRISRDIERFELPKSPTFQEAVSTTLNEFSIRLDAPVCQDGGEDLTKKCRHFHVLRKHGETKDRSVGFLWLSPDASIVRNPDFSEQSPTTGALNPAYNSAPSAYTPHVLFSPKKTKMFSSSLFRAWNEAENFFKSRHINRRCLLISEHYPDETYVSQTRCAIVILRDRDFECLADAVSRGSKQDLQEAEERYAFLLVHELTHIYETQKLDGGISGGSDMSTIVEEGLAITNELLFAFSRGPESASATERISEALPWLQQYGVPSVWNDQLHQQLLNDDKPLYYIATYDALMNIGLAIADIDHSFDCCLRSDTHPLKLNALSSLARFDGRSCAPYLQRMAQRVININSKEEYFGLYHEMEKLRASVSEMAPHPKLLPSQYSPGKNAPGRNLPVVNTRSR